VRPLRRSLLPWLVLVAIMPGLGGCDSLRRAVGLDRVIPDEFAVVSRAPLAIPNDWQLRPPRPGVARAQDVAPVDQAREVVFKAGDQTQAALPAPKVERSDGESEILREAGVPNTPANIREVLNGETSKKKALDSSFIDSLLFWRGSDAAPKPDATVLDPVKEAERLRAEKSGDKEKTGDKETPKATTAATAAPTIERTPEPSFFERLF